MIITRTPFRISFFGGGTDYPIWYEKNGGAVLSVAINKYCYVTCRQLSPFFDFNYRLRYNKIEETKAIHEIEHPSVRECLSFVNFDKRLEMQHNTDIPGMSGLGSSSAFTVGFLKALHALKEEEISKYDLAKEAIHVEQSRIKENVGSQDQTIAAFGGLRKILFGGPNKIEVSLIEMDKERSNNFQNHLMLFFTGYPRNASQVAAEQIKNTPHKEQELKRMRQMVEEAHSILVDKKSNLEDFGRLLHDSWTIKKSLSSQITTPVIDNIYQAGMEAGALGGKILGAGGGGFILFFVKPEFQQSVKEKLKNLIHVPFKFEEFGSKVIFHMPESKLGY